jgi:hypothetical protein
MFIYKYSDTRTRNKKSLSSFGEECQLPIKHLSFNTYYGHIKTVLKEFHVISF